MLSQIATGRESSVEILKKKLANKKAQISLRILIISFVIPWIGLRFVNLAFFTSHNVHF